MPTGQQKKIEPLITQEPTPQQKMELQPYYPDEEVSLVELWLLLWNYRRVVLASVLSAVALAGLISFILPTKYESVTVLKIGRLADVGMIEDANTLAARIRFEHKIDDDTEGKKEPPYMVKSTVAKGKSEDQSMVTLVAVGETAQQAAEFLHKETNSILQRHHALYEVGAATLQQSQTQAEIKLQENLAQIKALDSYIAEAATVETKTTLIQEKSLLTEENGRLSDTILRTEMKLSALQSYPTEVVRIPSVPLDPSRPKPLLYMAIAALVGLFVGFGLIMLMEFTRNVRAASSK